MARPLGGNGQSVGQAGAGEEIGSDGCLRSISSLHSLVGEDRAGATATLLTVAVCYHRVHDPRSG